MVHSVSSFSSFLSVPPVGMGNAANAGRLQFEHSAKNRGGGDLVALFERGSSAKSASPQQQSYRHPLHELLGGNSSFLNGFGKKVLEEYKEWTEEVAEGSETFLDHIQSRFEEQGVPLTDEELLQIGQQLDEWFEEAQARLDQRLEHAPPKLKEKLLEGAGRLMNELRGHLQDAIQTIIDRLNGGGPPPEDPPVDLPGDPPGDIPADPPVDPPPVEPPVDLPVDPPPVLQNPAIPLDPSTVFTGDRITIKVNVGTVQASILLQSPTSTNRSNALLYVVDAQGNKKALSINLGNSELEREFMKRFKKSKMYGQTISLEKLNRFIDRLKDFISSLSDIDIERLKSKLSGKTESAKLDSIIQQFDKFLLQLK